MRVPTQFTHKNPTKNSTKTPTKDQRITTPKGAERVLVGSEHSWSVEGLFPDCLQDALGTSYSLEYFVLAAAERNRVILYRRLDELGGEQGRRQDFLSPTYPLVSLLKGCPHFEGLDGFDAAALFEEEVARTGRVSEPWSGCTQDGELFIPDCDSFGNAVDDIREDFISNWNRWPVDGLPMTLKGTGLGCARELADRYPLSSTRYLRDRDQRYILIVTLCFWLARLRWNIDHRSIFFLGVRDAGEYAGCSPRTAGKLLERAVLDGLTVHLNRESRGPREAHEYSFDLDRVQVKPQEPLPEVLAGGFASKTPL